MASIILSKPLRSCPELKDLEPVRQDDGPEPVVAIDYTPDYVEASDYFRAILKANEFSERGLALAAEVIRLNPAHYTAWNYRRACLLHLKKDLVSELVFLRNTALRTPKNYQLWNHRRCVVEELKDPQFELDHTTEVLALDTKNYHVWAHRQWVCRSFSLWDQELPYTESLIEEDLRNNSAWNHRFFVLKSTRQWVDEKVQEREISFAGKYLERAPHNESPWTYLTGLLNLPSFKQVKPLQDLCSKLHEKEPACPGPIALLVDIAEKSEKAPQLEQAKEQCELLASRLDTVRERYWRWRKDCLDKQQLLQSQAGMASSSSAATESTATA